jgi:hypothetical protein
MASFFSCQFVQGYCFETNGNAELIGPNFRHSDCQLAKPTTNLFALAEQQAFRDGVLSQRQM